jgi:hypothetical protein
MTRNQVAAPQKKKVNISLQDLSITRLRLAEVGVQVHLILTSALDKEESISSPSPFYAHQQSRRCTLAQSAGRTTLRSESHFRQRRYTFLFST